MASVTSYTKTQADTLLGAKAPLASPTFTGTPTKAGTALATTSDVSTAVTTAINNLVNGAPSALDTLAEIASQLGNDETAATALTGLVNARAIVSTVALTAAGTLTGSARNTLDGSTAAFTAVLPAPTKVGQLLLLDRIDTSAANTITITGTTGATFRGNAAGTFTLPGVGVAGEGALLVAESLTSWTVAGSIKPKAWLDALYAPKPTGTAAAGKYVDGGTGAWTTLPTGGGASLPSQSGQSGRYLTTDGTNPSWAPIPLVAGSYNLTSSSMRNAKFAWGRMDAPGSAASTSKTGSFHVAVFGDSNGLKPGGNNSYTYADRLKALLDRDSMLYNAGPTPLPPIWFDAVNHGTPPNFPTPVVTLSGTWTDANHGPFEKFGITSSTAGSKITRTQVPTIAGTSNTSRIHWRRQTGGGSFTVATTSNGSFSAQSTAGAEGEFYTDYNGGDGGITITVDGAGPVEILGWDMHRQLNGTTTPTPGTTPIRADQQLGVKVSRFAVAGYAMEQLALDNGVSSSLAYAFDFLKPDLAVVALMTNDGNPQVPLATYTTSATAVATRAKAAGCDVLFVGCPPYSSDSSNSIKIAQYSAAIRSVCDSTNSAYLDIPSLWGDYTTALNSGLMDIADSPANSGPGLHMSPAGVTAYSQAIYDTIRACV